MYNLTWLDSHLSSDHTLTCGWLVSKCSKHTQTTQLLHFSCLCCANQCLTSWLFLLLDNADMEKFVCKKKIITNDVACSQSHVQRFSWTWNDHTVYCFKFFKIKSIPSTINNKTRQICFLCIFSLYSINLNLGHFIPRGHFIYSTLVTDCSLVQQEIITL